MRLYKAKLNIRELFINHNDYDLYESESIDKINDFFENCFSQFDESFTKNDYYEEFVGIDDLGFFTFKLNIKEWKKTGSLDCFKVFDFDDTEIVLRDYIYNILFENNLLFLQPWRI